MSLLRQNSQEVDDAALGEELTKGTSHRVWATVIAAVVVSIAIAVYMIAGQKPPLATGEASEVWAHPQRTTTPGFDANGAPKEQETIDHVLVFAHLKIQNVSDKPLFLTRIQTNAALPDGVHTSYAATLTDYDRVFIAYPDLAPYHAKGISPHATLEPHQALDGMVVSSFQVAKQDWDARKDLNFSVDFQYQPSLKIVPHSAVVER